MQIAVYWAVSKVESHADCGVLGCKHSRMQTVVYWAVSKSRMQIVVYWAVSKVESHADCGVLGCEQKFMVHAKIHSLDGLRLSPPP